MLDSKYKILSIDGGGIKGLYSAVILERFEQRYGPIHEHFNLICGTSTGGIIALALAAGIPASDIVKFYTDKGPDIFPYKNRFVRKFHSLKSVLFLSKYTSDELKSAISEVFQEKRVGDCLTHVLIPAVNITTGKPYVFKSDYIPKYTRDSERLLSEIALATSAAPTYFPIVQLDTKEGGQQFVDGGLFANNPSLYGVQEFLANKVHIGCDDYRLLSISSLHEGTTVPITKKLRRPFWGWKDELISLMIDSQSVATHFHVKYLIDSCGGEYVRIPSAQLTKQEQKKIELDMAHPSSIQILLDKGKDMSAEWINKSEVMQFFDKTSKEATA
ncbi:CBASS cGAMP-activated phospholipase [Paenibacillus xylanexedens]|uniref:CBASS cGAMP-activated phospholipase n=1 Tax=Paenibacillus xylanexedens TaxID=528191 RepID=UPI001B3AD3CB|nr:CBASS cGAMP-activated phospholipase [Paenibacillus xylanexedens]